jgi:hypothetical protein
MSMDPNAQKEHLGYVFVRAIAYAISPETPFQVPCRASLSLAGVSAGRASPKAATQAMASAFFMENLLGRGWFGRFQTTGAVPVQGKPVGQVRQGRKIRPRCAGSWVG